MRTGSAAIDRAAGPQQSVAADAAKAETDCRSISAPVAKGQDRLPLHRCARSQGIRRMG